MNYIAVLEDGCLQLHGQWTLPNSTQLQEQLKALPLPESDDITIDGQGLEALDTSGALFLTHLIERASNNKKHVTMQHFESAHETLLRYTQKEYEHLAVPPSKLPSHGLLYMIGKQSVKKFKQMISFVNFIGFVSIIFGHVLTFRKKFHWRGVLLSLEDAGYNALPIIGLLMFLVGIVLSYQLGQQLTSYGANIFIVNLTGLAVLREFGPLIAAIIAAGRTSSAYTAQIGLMRVNEEIDALQVMGLSPINRITLPKIIGVVIAMPLVTIWADAFGVFGSMVMTEIKFDISMADFLQRFDDVTELSTLWTGMMKAPFFGLIIASVGCYKGMRVKYTASSIGHNTTKSVVQAIFLVIVADAMFSILFSWAGI